MGIFRQSEINSLYQLRPCILAH